MDRVVVRAFCSPTCEACGRCALCSCRAQIGLEVQRFRSVQLSILCSLCQPAISRLASGVQQHVQEHTPLFQDVRKSGEAGQARQIGYSTSILFICTRVLHAWDLKGGSGGPSESAPSKTWNSYIRPGTLLRRYSSQFEKFGVWRTA